MYYPVDYLCKPHRPKPLGSNTHPAKIIIAPLGAQRIWRGGNLWCDTHFCEKNEKKKLKKDFLDFLFFSPESLGYVLATFWTSGTPSIDL